MKNADEKCVREIFATHDCVCEWGKAEFLKYFFPFLFKVNFHSI